MRTIPCLIALGSLGIAACGQVSAAGVVDDEAIQATEQGGDWLAFGRAYDEQWFSPLAGHQ